MIPEADAEVVFQDVCKGVNLTSRIRDRGLSVRHLARFFDATIWKGFDDEDKVWTIIFLYSVRFIILVQGFFTIYRNLFSRLHAEEKTFDPQCDLPSFGYSTWNWAAPKEEEAKSARPFYNAWLHFITEKDFSWMDQWSVADAPERRVRR